MGLDRQGPSIAVDNDLIIKAACYRVASVFWTLSGAAAAALGILGAAPYVARSRIRLAPLSRPPDGALAELDAILQRATVLEPDDEELRWAAELEVSTTRAGFELDTGESQLAVMVASRALNALETGDKRGIRGLEAVADAVPHLVGRVRCLEQIVEEALADDANLAPLTAAVCAEPEVDKILTICFACRSDQPPSRADVLAGLASYVSDLRKVAARLLVA